MKKFKYTATNLYGKKFQGTFLAENEKDLRSQLANQNLYLVKAKAIADKSPSRFFSVTGKVSSNELCTFCRQFAILVDSGTSIIDSLNILRRQSYSAYMKKLLEQVYEDVKAGKLLSEALRKHSKTFPAFFAGMMRIGEISGQIDKVLCTCADYFEAEAKIKIKTKSALAYPAMLIVLAVALVVLMVALIIPTFRVALSSLEIEMPPLTLAVFAVGEFFQNNWEIIVILVLATVGLSVLFINTKRGRFLWDRLKFYFPCVRKVIINGVSARFCRSFSVLIGSGMDIVEAMEEAALILGNAYAARKFAVATDDVRQGVTLTLALQNSKIFPEMLVQMVAVGESTDKLDVVLEHACPYFESRVERSLETVTRFIQPVILSVIGVIVGVLFYAVYAPMVSVMNGLG